MCGDGLGVDPAKVKAVLEMPAPTDKAGIQRLLGMIQYLSKFLPHLSDMTKPLRDLTRKDVEWCWGDGQDSALKQIKEAVTCTPVLQYYNLEDEVTLQYDASQHGLGEVLLQKGQPVPYASRALTPIEKELLAIVFACERFKAYIFDDLVNMETDQKPLEAIVLNPLHAAPLHRMLLRLQKFNLQIKYQKGTQMFLADTLSRANLPEVETCSSVHDLRWLTSKQPLP